MAGALHVRLLHRRVPLLFRQGLVLFGATAAAALLHPQNSKGDDSCQISCGITWPTDTGNHEKDWHICAP